MRRIRLPALALALCPIAACEAPAVEVDPVLSASTPTPGVQNVLIIIADDLGVDKVGVYASTDYASPYYADHQWTDGGAGRIPRTPSLDRLARAGVRFTDAWATPYCSPTRASIYTGRHGFRTGIGAALSHDRDPFLWLESGETTIAELATAAGYATGHFGKWHLGDPDVQCPDKAGGVCATSPLDQGWSYFAGSFDGEPEYYSAWHKYGTDSTGALDDLGTSTTYAPLDTVTEAATWIGAQTGPWLATVAFKLPHTSLAEGLVLPADTSCYTVGTVESADPLFPDSARIHQAMVECLDSYVGTLIKGMSKVMLSKTTIIFIGDNGTVTDSCEPEPTSSSCTDDTLVQGDFDDGRGKGTLYESGVRVPFIVGDGYIWLNGKNRGSITGAGQVKNAPRTVGGLVQAVDVFATAAAIMGASVTTSVDGISFGPHLLDLTRATPRAYAYSEHFADDGSGPSGEVALRDSHCKLIVHGVTYPDPSDCTGTFGYGATELWDLATNRYEDAASTAASTCTTADKTALFGEVRRIHREWLDDLCP